MPSGAKPTQRSVIEKRGKKLYNIYVKSLRTRGTYFYYTSQKHFFFFKQIIHAGARARMCLL